MGFRLEVFPGNVIRITLQRPVSEVDAKQLLDRVVATTDSWPRTAAVIDLHGSGTIPGDVAKAFTDQASRIKRQKPNRVAIIGAATATRVVAAFVTSVVPAYRNTRFFGSEPEAMVWLTEPDWTEFVLRTRTGSG